MRRRIQSDNEPLGYLANLYPGDFSALFRAEEGTIIRVRVVDAAILTIRRKDDPVRSISCSHAAGKFPGLQVINVNAIIQQTGDPQFLAVGSKGQTMS